MGKASCPCKASEDRYDAPGIAPTACVSDEPPFTDTDIILVQTSWVKVAELGKEAVGISLFKNIFEIAPEALQLFKSIKDEPDIYETPWMKAHVVKVIVKVGTAVEGLRNLT